MIPRVLNRVTTKTGLRKREAAARAVQSATGPAAELERLRTHVNELLATVRRLELVNAGLQRRLDHIECCAEDED